jgi:hypothetical protein
MTSLESFKQVCSRNTRKKFAGSTEATRVSLPQLSEIAEARTGEER